MRLPRLRPFHRSSRALPALLLACLGAGSSAPALGAGTPWIYYIGGRDTTGVANNTTYYNGIGPGGTLVSPTWSTGVPIPQLDVEAAAIGIGCDILVIFGGGCQTCTAPAYFVPCSTNTYFATVDPATGAMLTGWIPTTPVPLADYQPRAVLGVGNWVYVIGGTVGQCWAGQYIPGAGITSWSMQPWPAAPSPNYEQAAWSDSQSFFACAGSGWGNQCYGANLSGGVVSGWAPTSALPTGAMQCGAMQSANGYMYNFAGFVGLVSTDDIYSAPIIGSTLGAWTSVSNLPVTMAEHDVLYDPGSGYFFCMGGSGAAACTGTGFNTVYSAQALVGGGVGPWGVQAPMPAPRYEGSVAIVYCAALSPTPSPSDTATRTQTFTSTPTFNQSATATPTSSRTGTQTSTSSPTATVSRTATVSPSNTRTGTATRTATRSNTSFGTPTHTRTSTSTSTSTSTQTETLTFTDTRTPSYTYTFTPTFTDTPSPTLTYTFSETATETLTFTETSTFTPTLPPSETQTYTFTLTPTVTATETTTFTSTATPSILAVVTVFNEAGEYVRNFTQGLPAMKTVPFDVTLGPNPFSPDGDGTNDLVFANFPDGSSVSWDGRNDAKQVVDNGIYFLSVALVDPRGVELIKIHRSITVLARGNLIRLRILDKAGEVRRSFPERRLPATVSDLSIAPNPFTPGISSTTGLWYTCLFKLVGTDERAAPTPPPAPNDNIGIVISWLGDDVEGRLLTNGVYWAELVNTDPRGKTTRIVRSVVILRPNFELLKDARAYPNPKAPDDSDPFIHFAYTIPNADPVDVVLKIFDLQGQLVATRDSGRHGSPDIIGVPFRYRISWNSLNAKRKFVSDGLYFAELSARDQVTGVLHTKRVKFSVLKRKG